MSYEKGQHPGAIWKRVDFQVHTPRDPNWNGSPHLPGGTFETESERERWADDFVAKSVELRLGAISITDHHDFCFVEYVRRAIERLPADTARPWLFPGVEVTCRDAVQCLVLFDQDTDKGTWFRLFGGHLQNINSPDPDLPTNPQADECGKDVEDFIIGVTSDSVLSNSSIIFPHASDENSHKSMNRQGFAPRFRKLPFDGVYTDKSFDKLKAVTKRKIYGEIQEWGERRRGIIPTGDNRHQDFRDLGAHVCWIRLGEPTTEAIRQSVLADEARIAYEAPTIPTQRILSFCIDSTLTGENFGLSLNDGFTALIGGRGAGKSALLEYLRFGLGRSASDTTGIQDDARSRDQRLVSDTLKGGKVSVVLERDGVVETWTRYGQSPETIWVSVTDSETAELSISSAQQRFRARAFYQKQLSTLVLDESRASEHITSIAAAEFIEPRRTAERDIAASKRKVRAAYQALVEYWMAESEHKESKASLSDLRRRLDAVQSKLGEAGLTPENQEILEAAPIYRQVSSLSEEATGNVEADILALKRQLASLSSLKTQQWEQGSQFAEIERVVEATKVADRKVNAAVHSAIQALEELQESNNTVFAEFFKRRERFEEQHAAAMQHQDSLQSLLTEVEEINGEIQHAETAERKSASRLEELKEAPNNLERARDELVGKIGDLRSLMEEAAGQVEGMSETTLRAEAKREQAPREYVDALMGICDRNRIRDVQVKCEDRAYAISSDGDMNEWRRVTDEILEVHKHKVQTGESTADPSEEVGVKLQNALLGKVTEQQLRGLYDNVDDSTVSEMLLATPEDYVSFEYRDGDEFIPFEQASPGQQSSALLHLLLNQEAGTLLIDQPEDDLDNRVVMRLAKLLQTTKRKRQLIFATHNPNFVVNGDADKVVVLAARGAAASEKEGGPRISVDNDGAIETAPVRGAIAETMEGGRAAFELRSRKYSFQ